MRQFFLFSVGLLVISVAAAQPLRVDLPKDRFLTDRAYQKEFLDTYIPLREAEPKINPEEVPLFQDLLALIEVQPAAAAARLEAAITPNSSAALAFVLGNLYLQSGEMQKAASAYERAIAKFSDYRRAHKNLGLVHFQNQNWAKAQEHMTKAIQLGDRDASNYGRLAYTYLQLSDAIAAESAYRSAIVMEPAKLDWKLGLAQTLMTQSRHTEVIAMMEPIIDRDSANAQLWLFQTNAFLGAEQLQNAAINLEIVRRLGAADSRNLQLLGNVYLRLEQPERALDAFSAVLDLNNPAANLTVAYDAAGLFTRLGNYAAARSLVAKIRTTVPNLEASRDLQLLTLEARIARADGREAEAAEILGRIVSRDPMNGEALIELGRYHASQGDSERAIFQFDAAARLEKFTHDALVAKGQMLARERKSPAAIEALRAALRAKEDARVENFLARVERAARSQ